MYCIRFSLFSKSLSFPIIFFSNTLLICSLKEEGIHKRLNMYRASLPLKAVPRHDMKGLKSFQESIVLIILLAIMLYTRPLVCTRTQTNACTFTHTPTHTNTHKNTLQGGKKYIIKNAKKYN